MVGALLSDVREESAFLLGLLEPLSAADYATPTPSPGWTIHDQITHLAYFDALATAAATDRDRFIAERDQLVARGEDFTEFVAAAHRDRAPDEVRDWFARARAELVEAFEAIDPHSRLPWFGPDMSPASSLTARLMETWAHGVDVTDALGVEVSATPRLRHVAHLGVATFRWSFVVHGRPEPTAPLRVELVAPDGESWTWGPAEAADRITGRALDFCLAVTQRRHVDDLDVQATGSAAADFLGLAQAFAGRPGRGRAPRSTLRRPS